MRGMSIYTCALIVALGTSIAAADGDAPKRDVAAEKSAAKAIEGMKKALSKKDDDAIGDAISDIASIYEDVKDAKLRDRLRKAIGKALKRKSHDVKVIALDAFTRMEDPLAWKYIAPYLKQSNAKKEPQYYSQALRAVETLTPPEAVPTLLGIIQNSKHLGVAARAMKAFAAYKSGKIREKILSSIIATVRKERPGVKGRENPLLYGAKGTGSEARTRWEALAGPLVEAANGMTGQELGTAPAWFEFFRKNRRNPAVLFVTP